MPVSVVVVDIFGSYFQLGLRHIVPDGVDHILFVVGLFLSSGTPRVLLLQVTAFTLAHASTLVVGGLGSFSASPGLVEPLIAASIACVALENVRSPVFHVSRVAVVFGFGLLHGLGFAGGLNASGLPQGRVVLALFGFNVGVEVGQLLVIVASMGAVGWARHRHWYRDRVAVPLSWLVGLIGLYWTWTRLTT